MPSLKKPVAAKGYKAPAKPKATLGAKKPAVAPMAPSFNKKASSIDKKAAPLSFAMKAKKKK